MIFKADIASEITIYSRMFAFPSGGRSRLGQRSNNKGKLKNGKKSKLEEVLNRDIELGHSPYPFSPMLEKSHC